MAAKVETRPSHGRNLTLGFGLVNVPISLKPLVDAKGARTGGHYLCSTHMSRVKMKYECEDGGHLLGEGERITGYPVPGADDTYVSLDEAVIQDLADEKTGVAKINAVVDVTTIDPLYFSQTYLCYPQKGANEGFDLIRELLEESGQALVTTAVLSKQTVQLVIRYSPALGIVVGHICVFAERIRENDVRLVKDLAGEPDKTMLKMAGSLFASLKGEFDPHAVDDSYSEALNEAIVAAAKGKPLTVKEKKPAASPVDLMDALKASLAAATPVTTTKPKGRKKVAA